MRVNARTSVLKNGESADMSEDAVSDWSLRFPLSAMATSLSTIQYVDMRVPESHVIKWSNPSWTTTLFTTTVQCDVEYGHKRGVLISFSKP